VQHADKIGEIPAFSFKKRHLPDPYLLFFSAKIRFPRRF
jgi:hypothetical protein